MPGASAEAATKPRNDRGFVVFRWLVYALLAGDVVLYARFGRATELLDTAAWFVLLLLFEWETGGWKLPTRWRPALHGVRAEDTIRRFAGPTLDVARETEWILQGELNDVEGVIGIEGIGAFIERLAPGSWAVVTSATRALAEVRMRAAKIPIPEVMITAENVHRGKPDPEGFLLAAKQLGVPIRDCLVFEDSPAGVAAGKAAGAHVAIVGGHVPGSEGQYALVNYL